MQIKYLAYKYQEGSVWYHWYDTWFTNICNRRQGNGLRIGGNGGLTDYKYQESIVCYYSSHM